MPLFQTANDMRSARRKQVGFAAVAGAIFLALLIYGLRPGPPPPGSPSSALSVPDQAAAVREDTAIPTCESDEAMQGVRGQLVRTQTTRINGLSNVQQIASSGGGDRTCRATVNLDFGTQTVTYVIRRDAPGRKTWVLEVTGR